MSISDLLQFYCKDVQLCMVCKELRLHRMKELKTKVEIKTREKI